MLLILFCTLIGMCFGSLLGVIVDRFETNRSWVFGRSVCDACDVKLQAIDLIPVFSFLLLCARCRRCHKRLSWKYPLLEILLGAIFALVAVRYTTFWFIPIMYAQSEMWMYLVRDLFFVFVVSVLCLLDARHGVLPDSWTLPAITAVVLMNLWLGMPILTILTGALVCGGFFALQYLVSCGRWVGDGDIRFGVLIGVIFGMFQGVFTIALAYIIGALYALVLLAQKRANRTSELRFGPFLAMASLFVLVFGTMIANRFFLF